MAGFMENAIKRSGEILLVVSRGQAGVARAEARTKRVGRGVDPAGGEVESDCLRDLAVEGRLRRRRVGTGEQAVRKPSGMFGGGPDERGNLWRQFREERGDIRRACAHLIFVEKSVIPAGLPPPGVGLLACQHDQLPEVRLEHRKVRFLPCLRPDTLCE